MSSGPSQSFEVLNRGARVRRHSAGGLDSLLNVPPGLPRSLSDVDWLERRQNVNAVGELDYVLTQMNREKLAPPADTHSARPLIPNVEFPAPILPSKPQIASHVLLHVFVFATCILSLIALWQRAPKVTFFVFLVVTVFLYAMLFLHGLARISSRFSSCCHAKRLEAPSPIASTDSHRPSNP